MYQTQQPPIRRLSAQSIPSTNSTHSSPHTSPPTNARGFHPHPYPNRSLHQHLYQMMAPCRQLHPPKALLYRPAVLRATDRPARSRNTAASTLPPSPPAGAHADVFGEIKREAFGGDPAFGDADVGAAAAAVDDLSELVGEDGDGDGGKAAVVTGPPCRAHWKVRRDVLPISGSTC